MNRWPILEKLHQGGNIQAPSKVLCLEWVQKAWECVIEDIVKKSLNSCGISDGPRTEDNDINFVKNGRVVEDVANLFLNRLLHFKP